MSTLPTVAANFRFDFRDLRHRFEPGAPRRLLGEPETSDETEILPIATGGPIFG